MVEKLKDIIKYFSEQKIIKTELNYNSEYELLIAIILSARCTDKCVNIVTVGLFKHCPDFEALSKISFESLDRLIYSVTYHNEKAKRLIALANIILDKYDGIIPKDRDILITFPGIGRKTANLFLAITCDMPYIAVDTHVMRVSNRLGIVESNDPLFIESELDDFFPEEYHNKINSWFVIFGRYKCKAISPICTNCPLSKYCNYSN